MYFIIKAVVLFLAMMLSGTFVSAQFFSFHQAPQSYINGKGVSVSYTGFHNQFEPLGVSGCVMGIASLRSECTYVSGGLSFSLSGAQNSTQFKVYVPAGVTSFIFSGYLPQGMQAAVAVRMGSAPTRTNPLSATEYANYQAARNLSTVYQRLSAGDEVIMVADGGGSFSLAGNNNFSTPLAKGAWLYFRLINGDYIDTPRATYEIDLSSYIAGYNAITTANGWGGDGDPLENGATVTPSFSIKLNGTLTQGVSSTIGITPSGGTLKNCSASSVEVSASSYANNSVTLTPSSTATSVTITCESAEGGSAKASLQVQTAPATAFSSFTLSPASLLKTETATLITVKPNNGAVVPASTVCQVMQSQKYLVPAGTNQWKISSDVNVQQIAQSLTIDCGSDASGKAITSSFTIKMPLVAKSPIGNALEFNFLPSGTATTADLYIAGYIKDILLNKLTGKVESAWICRSNDDSNWVYMPGAILPRICKRSGIKVNDKVRIAIDTADIAGIGSSSVSEYFFTFSEKTLKDAKVELYGAYTTDNGNSFNFIGDDNTGTFSAQPPVGANINALYIFK